MSKGRERKTLNNECGDVKVKVEPTGIVEVEPSGTTLVKSEVQTD